MNNIQETPVTIIHSVQPFASSPQATNIPTTTNLPITTPENPPAPKAATLTFTGDLMVHSYQYEAAYDRATNTYDFSNNFTSVKKYFKKSDYVIGNLETTLGGTAIGISDYPRFNTPDSFAKALKNAGFDLLTTANNHCVDRGTDALLRTIDVLDKLKFDHIGTYQNESDSKKIFIKEINGIQIAFISCTYGTNGLPYKNDYNVKILNDHIYKEIKKARKLADFVIVLPHNGTEYAQTPSETYKAQYKKMLKSGADAVIASHPHVLQPMEYIEIPTGQNSTRKGFIMYSMGNFISSQVTKPRDAGVILNLTIKEEMPSSFVIDKVTVIPTWCRFMDASSKRNFTVFTVYDILKMSEKKRKSLIRDKDFARVQQIQLESTKTLLGKSIPVKKAKKSYKFTSS
ncbi:MAG: CapA family protein [Lachnospiraceae bacterium]|nr:CapA family protein [Lachnospiraceae bacterium]